MKAAIVAVLIVTALLLWESCRSIKLNGLPQNFLEWRSNDTDGLSERAAERSDS